MSSKSTKQSKDQKLKSALRENLKKRKQFARALDTQDDEKETLSVQLRKRDISAKKPD